MIKKTECKIVTSFLPKHFGICLNRLVNAILVDPKMNNVMGMYSKI